MRPIFRSILSLAGATVPRQHCCQGVSRSIQSLALSDGPAGAEDRDSRHTVRRVAGRVLPLIAVLIAGCSAPVEVNWSTETEMNTAGFNLYRSESDSGPFDLKVNDQLIAASPDPLTGGDYTYIDRTAQSGVTYYYELEEVEQTGATTRHGPIPAKSQGNLGIRDALLIVVLGCGGFALWLSLGKKRPRRNT